MQKQQTFALPLLVHLLDVTSHTHCNERLLLMPELLTFRGWFREHQLIASPPEGILAKKQTLTSNHSFSLLGSYKDNVTGFVIHASPKTFCEMLHPECTLVTI